MVGSFSCTSRPTPIRRPVSRAETRAADDTSEPRAMFMNLTCVLVRLLGGMGV